jgi:cell division protein FtsW
MPRDTTLRSTFPRLSTLAAAPRESRTMLTFDTTLAWAALLLLSIGLVMVYSASIATAETMAYTGYVWCSSRHAVFVSPACLRRSSHFRFGQVWQLAPAVAGAALLVAVLLPDIGKAVNGNRRWLSLVINVQPSNSWKLSSLCTAAMRCAKRISYAQQPLKEAYPGLPLLRDGRHQRYSCEPVSRA